MKFLVDAQLPPALAQWLREAGHEAEAVREIGLREASDTTLWQHARVRGAVIVTKDEDFALRAQQDPTGPIVVWVRSGNTSNRVLRARFLPQLARVLVLIGERVRLVEVR